MGDLLLPGSCPPNMPGLGHTSTEHIISWNQTAGRSSPSCSQVFLFMTRTRSTTSESSSLLICTRGTGPALGALPVGKMDPSGRSPSPSNEEYSNTKNEFSTHKGFRLLVHKTKSCSSSVSAGGTCSPGSPVGHHVIWEIL